MRYQPQITYQFMGHTSPTIDNNTSPTSHLAYQSFSVYLCPSLGTVQFQSYSPFSIRYQITHPHEKPGLRESWVPHASEGWYIGPTMDHYQYFRVWDTATNSERIVDTIVWFLLIAICHGPPRSIQQM